MYWGTTGACPHWFVFPTVLSKASMVFLYFLEPLLGPTAQMFGRFHTSAYCDCIFWSWVLLGLFDGFIFWSWYWKRQWVFLSTCAMTLKISWNFVHKDYLFSNLSLLSYLIAEKKNRNFIVFVALSWALWSSAVLWKWGDCFPFPSLQKTIQSCHLLHFWVRVLRDTPVK